MPVKKSVVEPTIKQHQENRKSSPNRKSEINKKSFSSQRKSNSPKKKLIDDYLEDIIHEEGEEENIEEEEVVIDEHVIRLPSKNHVPNLKPKSMNTENSRIYDALECEFPLQLHEELTLPDFNLFEPVDCINYLGKIMGCENHDDNLVSFWILDTLSDIIKQGQLKNVSNENLKIICLWFAHLLKMLSVFAPSRKEFFQNVCEMLRETKDVYLETEIILRPQEVNNRISLKRTEQELEEDYLAQSQNILANQLNDERTAAIIQKIYHDRGDNKKEVKPSTNDELDNTKGRIGDTPVQDFFEMIEEESAEDCSKLNELQFLTEQIYSVFGNRFKFEVIKTVLSTPPDLIPIIVVENINFPKALGISQKTIEKLSEKKRDDEQAANRKSREVKTKSKKGKKGLQPEVQENEAVGRFKEEMKELDRKRELEKQKAKTQFDFVKPLDDSVDEKFFQRLFPTRETILQPKQSIRDVSPTKKKKKK